MLVKNNKKPYFIVSNSTALNRFLSVRSIPSNNKFNSCGVIINTLLCTFGNLKIPRSNISTYIRDLEDAGCVYLRRKNGKDKFWKADPKIRWSLLKESPQQVLNA